MDKTDLEEVCRIVRSDIVKMTCLARSGHPGGSLSAVELLVGLYFGGIIRVDPKNPEWEERDRFILSKGHVGPVLYSVLSRMGYFPEDELWTLRKFGSILQGHPHMGSTPGLDCSSGSLGQGLSVANGMALAFQKRGMDSRVYCLLGDGELQEGQVWEAFMTAAHHRLDHVCAIVDRNYVQLDGEVEEIKALGDVAAKLRDFNWNVIELDGHDLDAVMEAYRQAARCKGKPTALVAKTIKGKGVSFMEGKCEWHGQAPNEEQMKKALAEINQGGR